MKRQQTLVSSLKKNRLSNQGLRIESNYKRLNLTPWYAVISLYLLYIGFALTTIKNSGADVAFGSMAEMVRIITLGPAYLLALLIVFSRQNLAVRLLSKIKLYLFFIAYCMASSFWSDVPYKVLLNSAHDIGYLIIGILLVLIIKDRGSNYFFRHLASASLIIIIISIYVAIFFPRLGVHETLNRWQGITGNPNTLGMFCVISIWSLLMIIQLSSSSSVKLVSYVMLGIPFFALFGGGIITSAASLIVSVFLFFSIQLSSILQKGNVNIRLIKTIGISFLFIFGVLSLALILPEIFDVDYVLSKMGRDRSMSGRTKVWEFGLNIFYKKPWLGWGFDGLVTVMNRLHFEIKQFHNGYLDLAVRGGIISLCFLFGIVFNVFHYLLLVIRRGNPMGLGMILFCLSLLVHNVAEASIMRPTNLYWFTFLVIYLFASSYQLLFNSRSGR